MLRRKPERRTRPPDIRREAKEERALPLNLLGCRDGIRNSPSGPNKLVIERVKVDLCITFNQHAVFG
jgi:hypothetical protein